MAYSHKGLGKTYSFISQRTTRARIQWKRVFGTLFKIGLVGIVTTLYLWVERPGVMVCIGFAISNLFVFAKVVEHITETRSEDVEKIRKSIRSVLVSSTFGFKKRNSG